MHENLEKHPKKDLIALLATVTPNADRLIVVPQEVETLTKSGVIRAQTAKGESETELGFVIAVGKGYMTEYGVFSKTRAKVGDLVVMDRFAGVRFRMDKNGKFYPQHVDIREDNLPVRILRQEAVLLTLPASWPL